MKGKGKQVYYDAVRAEARREIANPITSDDIEIEIAYATSEKRGKRKDADNVNKPTLDAFEGVAYLNDRQVRSVTSTIFDKNMPRSVVLLQQASCSAHHDLQRQSFSGVRQ
jgi:Holliday junction resolvase RusA-like endonuclease